MIIWLNGTFGAGKTATARELAATMPGCSILRWPVPEVASLIRQAVRPGG